MYFHVQAYLCVLSYKYKESTHSDFCLQTCPTNHRGKGIRVSLPWVRTDCHTFDPLFSPRYISPKPLFLPKIVTQSPILSTPSRILEIFRSKTPNRLEFEKKVPKCSLFFTAFVTERPPIFCPAYTCFFEGNVAPSNTVRSWKILYSRNIIVQFGEYFQVQI